LPGDAVATDQPHAANQDALDSLAEVCNEHGYSTQYCIDRWSDEHGGEHITTASPDDILDFAAKLIAEATDEGDSDPLGEPVVAAQADELF
jgi:hypothetical protein